MVTATHGFHKFQFEAEGGTVCAPPEAATP